MGQLLGNAETETNKKKTIRGVENFKKTKSLLSSKRDLVNMAILYQKDAIKKGAFGEE